MMRPLISCDLKVREKWMKWQKLHENGLSFFQNQYYCRLWKWVKRQWNCCQLFILLKKSTNIFTCQIFAIFRDNGDISASFSSHALGHFCTFSLLSLLCFYLSLAVRYISNRKDILKCVDVCVNCKYINKVPVYIFTCGTDTCDDLLIFPHKRILNNELRLVELIVYWAHFDVVYCTNCW